MEAAQKGDLNREVDLEISWVSTHTAGRHEYIPSDLLERITQEAREYVESL